MFAGPSWKEDIVTAERSLQFLGSFLSTFGTVKDDRQQKGIWQECQTRQALARLASSLWQKLIRLALQNLSFHDPMPVRNVSFASQDGLLKVLLVLQLGLTKAMRSIIYDYYNIPQ